MRKPVDPFAAYAIIFLGCMGELMLVLAHLGMSYLFNLSCWWLTLPIGIGFTALVIWAIVEVW